MKKPIITVLTVIILAGLLSLPAFAATTVQSGKCGEGVTWKLDTDGLLSISGTGPMMDYEVYTDVPWYSRRASVKSVSVGSGVTAIGDLAFNLCEELTAVSIADSVASIGEFAFGSCKKLQAIDLPNKVTAIGSGAFYKCESLTSVSIPYGVTDIADETFAYCKSLTSATIPNSVKWIGEDAFLLCTSLTSVTIPDSVTSLSSSAFQQCTKLQKVVFGKSVSSISYCAFYYCGNLKTIVFTGNAPNIKSDAFKNINAVAYYPGNNTTWTEDKKQDYSGTLTWLPLTCDILGKAHTVVVDAAVSPNCSETGLTEGSHCSVCGKILTAQEEIPANGHRYEAAFSWSEDLSAAVISAACACGETLEADCALSWDTATPGKLSVTASAVLEETIYTDSKEITAFVDGDMLTVVLPNEIANLKVIAAAYDSSQRMTGYVMPEIDGVTVPLTIAGEEIRVFFMDNRHCPMIPAMNLYRNK